MIRLDFPKVPERDTRDTDATSRETSCETIHIYVLLYSQPGFLSVHCDQIDPKDRKAMTSEWLCRFCEGLIQYESQKSTRIHKASTEMRVGYARCLGRRKSIHPKLRPLKRGDRLSLIL